MNHPVLMEHVDHTETTILETLDTRAVANEDSQEDTVIQDSPLVHVTWTHAETMAVVTIGRCIEAEIGLTNATAEVISLVKTARII